HHVIDTCIIAGIENLIKTAADHVTITNTELSLMSDFNSGIIVAGGNEINISNCHWFAGGGSGKNGILDTRTPPTNGFILTMVGNNFEGIAAQYNNVSGSYYTWLSGVPSWGNLNNPILQSNFKTSIIIPGSVFSGSGFQTSSGST